MCGIAGIVDLAAGDVSPRQLRAMADAIRHRGPDDEGYVLIGSATSKIVATCGPASPPDVVEVLPDIGTVAEGEGFDIGLAHRRFSIIDLSSGGHQPLCTLDQECIVTFNGEIFNFLELRLELERLGRRFTTRSDTEVLAEAYREWGCDCFERFRGFWAVAIYDTRARKVVLATDRLGKKPLYWTRHEDRIYFASEIKALLAIPGIAARKAVNEPAVYRWLAYGLRDVDHETMFAGISRIPGGCWAVADERFPANAVRYWEPPAERLTERELSPREAIARTRELLLEAVKLRLRADVPWCVELSGGVDSSTIVALISQIDTRPVTTFTVRFDDKEASEAHFARMVADRFRCDHWELNPTSENFWGDIRGFTFQMEEPYHSPNIHTHRSVWQAMRTHGSRVGLNGAGADEAFAGYASYFTPAIAQFLANGQVGAAVANVTHWSEVVSAGGLMRQCASSAIHLVPGLATSRLERSIRASCDWIRADFVPHPLRNRLLNPLLRAELTSTKIPYWLMADDKSAMGLPFEPRNPFMDHEVVDFACRLPLSYLVRDGWHKWVVRKAVEDLLPPEVLWRRTKMGFPHPERRFAAESSRQFAFILRQAENPLLDTSRLRPTSNGSVDWRIISYLLWHEMFINDNTDFFTRLEEFAHDEAGSLAR